MNFKRNSRPTKENNDLGFGTSIVSNQRFINKDGSFNVVRTGRKTWTPYQNLVEDTWPSFLAQVFSYYIVVNLLFAILIVIIGVESLTGVSSQSFLLDLKHAFFFSIQTFTTVGYGSLSPSTIGADLIASLIAFVGLLSFALATGLVFARFSKPKARILFSHHGVVCTYQDHTAFMFRIVNTRNHKIVDLEAQVSATWLEMVDGVSKRKFKSLALERDHIFLFPLNWTLVHPIIEGSPFLGKSQKEIKAMRMEVIVQIKGFDESYNQTVHANASYIGDEIIWGHRFTTMFESDEQNGTVVFLDRVDELMVDEAF